MRVDVVSSIEITEKERLILESFVLFCIDELKIESDIKLGLVSKENNLGITTGAYDRKNTIWCRWEGRAIIDSLRTIAHELVHMSQLENGLFNEDTEVQDVGGFIEDEANAVAGSLIKKFKNKYNCTWIYKL